MTGRLIMVRTMMLAVAALWSTQVLAADVGSVYVAPGGIYINSARVYVAPPPTNTDSSYAVPAPTYGVPQTGYAVPQQTYEGPTYLPPNPSYSPYGPYGPAVSAYGQARAYAPPPRAHVKREPAYYARVYSEDRAPRPPAAVPYGRAQRCVIPLGYGRFEYCD
jgi:hypothetical protein